MTITLTPEAEGRALEGLWTDQGLREESRFVNKLTVARTHAETYFIEELTFADADAILAMLRELCPQLADGHLPVWTRSLAYRLLLLQRPGDPVLTREAAVSLCLHGPDGDDIAADLERQADALDAAPRTAVSVVVSESPCSVDVRHRAAGSD